MAERRYTDTEVAEIFERATKAQQSGGRVPLASSDGMTLDALQEIGREVGLPPELVARAARSLERTGRPHTRRFLGLPLGVGRTVELERRLTDAEWERLVVDLRETFDARGRLHEEGAFRQWTNGNLHALLEPTESGQRLRLRTMNAMARAWLIGGLSLLGVAAVSLISGGDFASLGLLGTALVAIGALRLPGWARTRRRQMEEIATRVSAMAGKADG